MEELLIIWRFKNKRWVEYTYCNNKKEFFSLIQKRYRVNEDQIDIIKIETI